MTSLPGYKLKQGQDMETAMDEQADQMNTYGYSNFLHA